MPHIQLTPAQRKVHRAEAHHLDPVVMIGNDGLTAAVTREADAALKAHGLIKIRVLGDDRAAREAIYMQLADALNVEPRAALLKISRTVYDRNDEPFLVTFAHYRSDRFHIRLDLHHVGPELRS